MTEWRKLDEPIDAITANEIWQEIGARKDEIMVLIDESLALMKCDKYNHEQHKNRLNHLFAVSMGLRHAMNVIAKHTFLKGDTLHGNGDAR